MSALQTHEKDIELDGKQLEAVNACCDMSNRVVAITGAAGSGKTTVMRTVYERLVSAGYRVELVAPTGKASKRIREVTNIPAQTIHSLLEYTHPGEPDPKTGKPTQFSYPKRTRSNPVEADVILADEYSMLNTDVHRSLFDAMPNGASIRVFGDINQLQPIEEDKSYDGPSPFRQLLNNAKFNSVVLDTIHRQGKDSGILLNLQSVLRGRMPTKNAQWTIQFTDQPVDAIRDLVFDRLDEGVDFSSVDNQIITPQNTSWVGTVKLNAMIQMLFHDKLSPSVRIPRHDWKKDKKDKSDMPPSIPMFVGDKVIVSKNMHDLFVFNGEMGKLIEIGQDEELVIDFGDREVVIPPLLMVQNRWGKTVEIDPRKDIDLGYACTTHKMQGSECSRVVYVLNKSVAYMANRRNFYTATSRAKDHVHIITDQRTLQAALYKQG